MLPHCHPNSTNSFSGAAPLLIPNPTPIYSRFSRKADHPHASGNVIEEVWILARLDWKQSSGRAGNRVSSQNARRNSRARRHSWRRALCSPSLLEAGRNRLPGSLSTARQRMTSRLRPACYESNSSERHCLIRMCTDSSCPIPVFQGSQVLPLICTTVNQGLIWGLLQGHWELGSWLGHFYLFSTPRPTKTESFLIHISWHDMTALFNSWSLSQHNGNFCFPPNHDDFKKLLAYRLSQNLRPCFDCQPKSNFLAYLD